MTDKSKQHPSESKITELSEWQKRNKEYLEKKALEEENEPELDLQMEEEEISPEENASETEQQAEDVEEGSEVATEKTEEIDGEEEENVSESEEEFSEAVDEVKKSSRTFRLPLFKKKVKANGIEKRHLYRALPVLLISSITAFASLYFLSPLATQKVIEFSGNQQTDQQALYDKSRIKEEDYTLTTFLHSKTYEKNMETTSPWIKDVKMTYQFPVTFKVAVTEHQVFAYYVTGDDHYPVLENGEVVETVTEATTLPASYLSIRFSDRELVRQFVKQMDTMPASLKENMVSVDLTPSKVTKDLVTITMKNGNRVILPISQIKRKLPYYEPISRQVEEGTTIDMEAGVYSYSEQSLADAEAAKKQAEEEAKAAESTEETTENEEQALQEQQQEVVDGTGNSQ